MRLYREQRRLNGDESDDGSVDPPESDASIEDVEEDTAALNGDESEDSVSIYDIEEDPDVMSSEERNYRSMLARRARNQ